MRGYAHWIAGGVALGGSTLGFFGAQSKPKAPPKIDFNRDVRAILSEHCWPCHGSDSARVAQSAGLRLDSFAAATSDRGGYRAIAPHDLAHSIAWSRISSNEMPPNVQNVNPLSEAEKGILKAWIESGAEFKGHWAFLPPTAQVVPKMGLKNPIDNFVAASLGAHGLTAEPEADRETLIRRVALTLTGLPPNPEEVSAYMLDKRSDAYDRMVDHFLASPKYGENQARYWLDAIRYGDTHGLHLDNERGIWPFRDWVVSAYNRDLPFDKFTLWQVAGDLLPNPTLEQRLATGYVRMNPTTAEGGAIEQEFLVKNTFDRVDTTSTVFLGVTMGCAKCHDHKYDPFTAKDYYSMFAFFNSTADSPLDGNAKDHPPTIKVPSAEQASHLERLNRRMTILRAAVDLRVASAWVSERQQSTPVVTGWEVSGPYPARDFQTAYDRDDAPVSNPNSAIWKARTIKVNEPIFNFIGRDNASGYLRADFTVEREQDFTFAASSDDSLKVWQNGNPVFAINIQRAVNQTVDTIKLHLKAGKNQILFKVINGAGADGFTYAFGSAQDAKIAAIAKIVKEGKLDQKSEADLRATYLEAGPSSGDKTEYASLLVGINRIESMIPTSLVAQDLMQPRLSYILKRGQYDLPDKKVDRAIPAVFGTLRPDEPKNRLGLAEWMVDPKNPLVSRVMVNRIWQQHFGVGLVKSAEDFGSRGEYPSHPELLDYLAVELIADGWSIKQLHRLILTSKTFRQSAAVSSVKRAKDPDNRWVARGPRFRMDAEVIRDQALYVAGLLDSTVGGQGVKPYQPAGLWEAVGYTASNTARFAQDHGSALYRRSIYTFWKRTSPPPSMLIFDAPMRESCVVSRSRTNTPLQALVTLNDPQFVEAARKFARRVYLSGSTDAVRTRNAFKMLLAREPDSRDFATIQSLVARQKQKYLASPDAAARMLSIGESPRDRNVPVADHAAWTVACNTLLNLDEALTIH